jgi:hypothetical protein
MLIKITVSVLLVISLSLIAEYSSPKLAGVLGGFPTGSAISLFFFGVEYGEKFASGSALYNIAGLSSMLLMIFVYYIVLKYSESKKAFFPIVSSVLTYIIVSFLIKQMQINPLYYVVLSIMTAFFVILIMKKVEDKKIKAGERIKLSIPVLLLRGFIAAFIIVAITTAPRYFAQQWSGLLSAFPTMVLPLIIIVHLSYGHKHAYSIVKNVPVGIFTLIAYSFAVYFFYPLIGVAMGTVLAYTVAFFVLLLVRNLFR